MLLWLALTVTNADAACEPYWPIHFRVDLAMVTDALADQEFVDARAHLGKIRHQLLCLTAVVDASLFAKFARFTAFAHLLSQDQTGARRWLLSARLAAPGLPWNPVVFPPNHPLRNLDMRIESAAPNQLTRGLRPPKGGGIFLNGHLAIDASAPVGALYLAQAFDGDGTPIDGWWQDSGTFPDAYLTKRFLSPPVPSWWSPGR